MFIAINCTFIPAIEGKVRSNWLENTGQMRYGSETMYGTNTNVLEGRLLTNETYLRAVLFLTLVTLEEGSLGKNSR